MPTFIITQIKQRESYKLSQKKQALLDYKEAPQKGNSSLHVRQFYWMAVFRPKCPLGEVMELGRHMMDSYRCSI